jgi:ribonuclease-3
VKSLDLFQQFLFDEILELVDLDWKGPGTKDHCNRFHLMPRFARLLPGINKQHCTNSSTYRLKMFVN